MLKTDLRENKTIFTINKLYSGKGDETGIFTAEKILLIPDIVKSPIQVNQYEKQLDGSLKYWYVINGIRYTVIIAELYEVRVREKENIYLVSLLT